MSGKNEQGRTNSEPSQIKLSPREEEIVDLSLAGLTNQAVAHQLGISVGSVNTYWLRIKLKVGGQGKADTVGRVLRNRAETANTAAKFERKALADKIAEKESEIVELRAALALIELAMDEIKSTVWATDRDLRLYLIANGDFPTIHFGVKWEIGKTVYDIFETNDKNHGAVAAHLSALSGHESVVQLQGKFDKLFLRVMPIKDDSGEFVGCVTIIKIID